MAQFKCHFPINVVVTAFFPNISSFVVDIALLSSLMLILRRMVTFHKALPRWLGSLGATANPSLSSLILGPLTKLNKPFDHPLASIYPQARPAAQFTNSVYLLSQLLLYEILYQAKWEALWTTLSGTERANIVSNPLHDRPNYRIYGFGFKRKKKEG